MQKLQLEGRGNGTDVYVTQHGGGRQTGAKPERDAGQAQPGAAAGACQDDGNDNDGFHEDNGCRPLAGSAGPQQIANGRGDEGQPQPENSEARHRGSQHPPQALQKQRRNHGAGGAGRRRAKQNPNGHARFVTGRGKQAPREEHGTDEGETGALHRKQAGTQRSDAVRLNEGGDSGNDQRAADHIACVPFIEAQATGDQQRRGDDAGNNGEKMGQRCSQRAERWWPAMEAVE